MKFETPEELLKSIQRTVWESDAIQLIATRDSALTAKVREECEKRINPMIDKALNSMPAQQDGGGFIVEHFDQDGNYQGSENIPEMDVVQLLHGALLDIRAAIVGEGGNNCDI